MKTWLKCSVFATAIAIAGCGASPTGRHQLLLFSDNDMSALGAQSFGQMKQQQPISKDSKINAYVQCVSKALIEQLPAQLEFSEWEVVVFDSDQVNAFALPGGKIGVYTGLLKVANNSDQLAAVIGHEIAHVLAEHGNERLSQSQLADAGIKLTGVAIGSSGYAQYQQTALAALGLGVQYGVLLPYGRTQESEADILGLEIMAKAGFDPQQSLQLWKNMAKVAGGQQPPELLSTHPSHDSRIQDLSAKIQILPHYPVSKPDC
ncbi:M48 family metallopeptidase [Vibrio ostreicida]|uniref:M48 family metallopeptidase n=1 Tax=Vibrio ostreicida TaxID=526588 RepID=A0ABT8BWQ0_9VIBR|nr:M48 family metallopeptidase [Vibrio ostreicida]MDN3611612.1 M48 family metallopeptidase [Vibrio ostreicida]NPD09103.1 M48 family metallopeptidase [Vibrio ostreicida]